MKKTPVSWLISVTLFTIAQVLLTVQPAIAAEYCVSSLQDQEPAKPREHYKNAQAAIAKAGSRDRVTLLPGKHIGNIRITRAGITMFGEEGSKLYGTIHIDAPNVALVNLTVIDDEHCVVVGSKGHGLSLRYNRFVIGTLGDTKPETGVALAILGADTAGMNFIENQFYISGGFNPSINNGGLKYNWHPFDRAGTGILIRGTCSDPQRPLRIRHNRISGYQTGLHLQAQGEPSLNAVIWKNQITANTIGLQIKAADCTVEENDILRNTGSAMVVAGRDNLILANRIMDNAGFGIEATHANVANNVIVRNATGGIRAEVNCHIAHNTFYNNGGSVLQAETSGGTFLNNLIDHPGEVFDCKGAVEKHNNVYANCAGPEAEEGSRSGKLAYRNPHANDFRPLPDSIAVDAGILLPQIKRDVTNSGRLIGTAPDAGAFEVGPPDATGRDIWLSPAGNDDTGNGTESKPFATIARATRDARPDDHIYLQAGTYKYDSPPANIQIITCAGNEGHPVRIMPAPGLDRARDLVEVCQALKPLALAKPKAGKVVIEGGSRELQNCSYVVIEGIEFRESPQNVIHVGERASNITIRDNVFVNCPTQTPQGRGWHAGITGGGPESNDVLIENNIFDRRPNTDYHFQECDVINPFEGFSHCKRWTIRGNKIAGYGTLQLGVGGRPDYSTIHYPSAYHIVENNEFFECERAVHVKSSDNIIRNNHIHHMRSGRFSYQQAVGMMNRSGYRNIFNGNLVEDCPYAGMFVLNKDNTVVNNVFVRCETAVLVAYREFGAAPAKNTRVYHNTIIDCLRGVQVEPMCSAMVYNNIFYNSPNFPERPLTSPAIVCEGSGVFPLAKRNWSLFKRFIYVEPGLVHASHNLFWHTEPGYLRAYEGGHFNVYADPLFVDHANGDFRLRPDSPARGVGRPIYTGPDSDGHVRPEDGPDLGAFEAPPPCPQ